MTGQVITVATNHHSLSISYEDVPMQPTGPTLVDLNDIHIEPQNIFLLFRWKANCKC